MQFRKNAPSVTLDLKSYMQNVETNALREHRRIERVHRFFSWQTCSLHLNGESEGEIVILMELHVRPEASENVLLLFSASRSLYVQLLMDAFFE